MQKVDVIIVGAGAAGLMCAIEAAQRGRRVVILEHANRSGKKILMSGGGRCNFTNYHIEPKNYISHNPHFAKSALSRYTQWDFIRLVEEQKIPFHEKTLGQLFCDNKSQDILQMLLNLCDKYEVAILTNTTIEKIEQVSDCHFKINSTRGNFHCQSLVVASGGLSIPTMGASPFGYKVADQFGIKVWPTRAGLVPLTLHEEDKNKLMPLSGVSLPSLVSSMRQSFRENILFTHRGISGPAILQISSYWEPGESIVINMIPQLKVGEYLKQNRYTTQALKSFLGQLLPKRVVEIFLSFEMANKKLSNLSNEEVDQLETQLNHWQIKPNGTEGYRTAEVTLGGVDCDAISSKTMESKAIKGLYFIGEVLDVSGWLGGFNFQWAWSSGWAAGQVV